MSFATDLFAGQQIVVLGATSGIGAATALRFAELGGAVEVAGLNADGDDAPRHARVGRSELDVLAEGALAAYLGRFDRIDVLVNCVGISRDRAEWERDAFRQVIEINLMSVMDSVWAARAKMVAGGSIVTIASMYATFGAADRPAYSASKGAIVQLTKSLAQEFAAEGVRVNTVAPGWIMTPLSKGLFADAAASDPIRARIPMGRWGEAEEVADAVVFLASPAARYVTGASLAVDGGYLTV